MGQVLREMLIVFRRARENGEDCTALREELKKLGVGFNPDDGDIDLDYSTPEGNILLLEVLRSEKNN